MKRINYSFYILILFGFAVGSIVFTLLSKVSPLLTSKTLFLCQKYISNIMFELPRLLPSALFLALGVILGAGILSFLVQIGKTRILLRKLFKNKTNLPKKLAALISTVGLTNKVILVKDSNLSSFCCGIFSLHIVITTGLFKTLTKKELEAVLLHEQSHMVNRDPLKILIGKTFSSMFFFLPVFAELHRNFEAVNELLADQWTINHQHKAIFLRRALKKVLASPQFNLNVVANVSGPDYFEIRIHRLVNPGIKHKFRLSIFSLVITFLFVLTGWLILQTPVHAYEMNLKSNADYFLCAIDQTCPDQCHPYDEKLRTSIPTNLFLSEKNCDNGPQPSKTAVHKSQSQLHFPSN